MGSRGLLGKHIPLFIRNVGSKVGKIYIKFNLMLAINQYQDYGSERASDIHNYSKPNSRPGVAFQ